MSERIPVYHIRFAVAEELSMAKDGWLHCKTTPYYIFAQAFEGHYEVEAGNDRVVCERGGAFFSAPGTPLRIHHYVDSRTGLIRIRYLHFRLENEQGTDPFAVRTIPLAVSAADSRRIAGALARLIHSERERFTDNIRLLHILARLYRLTPPKPKASLRLNYVEQLCAWIRERAEGALAVDEVIAKSGYSRSKVFADFLEFSGMPPGDFILRERIVVSERMLLEHPERSIQQIASSCGWKNPFHFSRAFKSVAGVSPSFYRAHPLY